MDNGQLQQIASENRGFGEKLEEIQRNGMPAAVSRKTAEQAKSQRAIKKAYKAPAGQD